MDELNFNDPDDLFGDPDEFHK